MPQRTRVRIPLMSGGMSDAAADQGGMAPDEALDIRNFYFSTPSSLTVRGGSRVSDVMLDDAGVPANITSVPFVAFWESQAKIIAIGHSTVTSKHYLYRMATDGTGVVRFAMPAAYDVAAPVNFAGAGAWGDKFFLCDTDQLKGMCVFDNTTVTIPNFNFHADPDGPLKPKHLFVHRSHLHVFGYGDENDNIEPYLWRFSQPGILDAFNSADFEGVGATDEPLTMGVSLDEFALFFKERKIFRVSGDGRQSWRITPIDFNRGAIGPRHAMLYQASVWFISEQGFCRIGANGPSELIVDRTLLKWSEFDNLANAVITTIPEERLIAFGCHESSASGVYPNLWVCVDWRTGHWCMRDYSTVRAFYAAAIPQALPTGPTGAPTLLASTSLTTSGFQANWTNADTRVGITTRVEHRIKNTGSYVEDDNVASGVVLSVAAGKNSNTIYQTRVRHERAGIFSVYSNIVETTTVSSSVADPTSVVIQCVTYGGKSYVRITWNLASSSHKPRVTYEVDGTGGPPHDFNVLLTAGTEAWDLLANPSGLGDGSYTVAVRSESGGDVSNYVVSTPSSLAISGTGCIA